MKRIVGIVLIVGCASAQASRWVPVATGPEGDPAGLYMDKDSLKGTLPVRTVWEKFVNSYGEQKLSFVEMNCANNTLRTLAVILRSPNNAVLQSRKFPNAKSSQIGHDRTQVSARQFVCKTSKEKEATKRRALHR